MIVRHGFVRLIRARRKHQHALKYYPYVTPPWTDQNDVVTFAQDTSLGQMVELEIHALEKALKARGKILNPKWMMVFLSIQIIGTMVLKWL